MRRIYLDANGSCPSLKKAKEKLLQAAELFGNPSSSHDHGRVVRAMIDEARYQVAAGVLAKEKELIFTSGASEANRLFVDSLIDHGRKLAKTLHLLMSPFEHPSLLKPVLKAHDLGHVSLKIMDIDSEGALVFTPDDLNAADILIVCQAHNETGILPDLLSILSMARPDTIVMSDISQAYARIEAPASRVDIMTFSAQKMGGFAGVGGAIFRGNGKLLPPPWVGGGQERGLRPGTESSILIAAFGEAAQEVKSERLAHKQLAQVRDYFEETLASQASIKIIGQNLPRLPNTSAISFLGADPDALRIACDRAGLSVGFGAACSGLAPEGSFALKRLGLSLAEEKATVRFSFPSTITRSHVDETIDRLVDRVLIHRSRA